MPARLTSRVTAAEVAWASHVSSAAFAGIANRYSLTLPATTAAEDIAVALGVGPSPPAPTAPRTFRDSTRCARRRSRTRHRHGARAPAPPSLDESRRKLGQASFDLRVTHSLRVKLTRPSVRRRRRSLGGRRSAHQDSPALGAVQRATAAFSQGASPSS